MVHDIKIRKEKKNEIACGLMLAKGPQSTIRYFHLVWLMKSSYQKAKKKIVKRKNKRIEREVDSRYVEGVIDVK